MPVTILVISLPEKKKKIYFQYKIYQPLQSFSVTLESHYKHVGGNRITNIKGLWSFLGDHVEDLFRVRDPVGNSQIFVPAAQLCTDVIQCDSFVTVALRKQKPQ